jgi:hypothetical protein
LAASRVARRLWRRHHGATRAFLAAKIVPVKQVGISCLWYESRGGERQLRPPLFAAAILASNRSRATKKGSDPFFGNS